MNTADPRASSRLPNKYCPHYGGGSSCSWIRSAPSALSLPRSATDSSSSRATDSRAPSTFASCWAWLRLPPARSVPPMPPRLWATPSATSCAGEHRGLRRHRALHRRSPIPWPAPTPWHVPTRRHATIPWLAPAPYPAPLSECLLARGRPAGTKTCACMGEGPSTEIWPDSESKARNRRDKFKHECRPRASFLSPKQMSEYPMLAMPVDAPHDRLPGDIAQNSPPQHRRSPC